MSIDFTESHAFTRNWNDLGLSDDEFQALQALIMSRPEAHPVISGTGGLRKARFAPASWSRGKSGALRVCYACFLEYRVVYLLNVYSKSRSDNIAVGHKKAYRHYLEWVANELARKSKR